MAVKRTFSGFGGTPEPERKKTTGKMRIYAPVLVVLAVFLVYTFVIKQRQGTGEQSGTDRVAAENSLTRFHYAAESNGAYVLAYTDVETEPGLSMTEFFEKCLKEPPEGMGYMPISDGAFISGVTMYDRTAVIDFTEHPCPGDGEAERLTAIAWTAGGYFKADFVRVTANGETLGEYSLQTSREAV